jgi:hypothetical protein
MDERGVGHYDFSLLVMGVGCGFEPSYLFSVPQCDLVVRVVGVPREHFDLSTCHFYDGFGFVSDPFFRKPGSTVVTKEYGPVAMQLREFYDLHCMSGACGAYITGSGVEYGLFRASNRMSFAVSVLVDFHNEHTRSVRNDWYVVVSCPHHMLGNLTVSQELLYVQWDV